MDKQKDKTKYRISTTTSVFLVLSAIILDIITFFLPVVGGLVEVVAAVIYGIYFYLKGLGIISGKRVAVVIIDVIAKIIPLIQEIPFNTAAMLAILFMVRVEDKTGINVVAAINPAGAKSIRLKTRNPIPQKPMSVDQIRSRVAPEFKSYGVENSPFVKSLKRGNIQNPQEPSDEMAVPSKLG
ncbi:MAG: hypothetical protein NTV72_00285 [Candidatus Taylorbacteria bacterium]|nr:hypothetical protein [Candidatus Taylorbacteria bacterium]